MAKTGLVVQLKDTALGTPRQSNGNCMIVYGASKQFTASPFTDGLALFTTYSSAAQCTDIAGDAHLLADVKKFYDIAGDGAKLWIYTVATAKDDFVTSNAEAIKAAIIRTGASTFDNRPRIIGWMSAEDDTVDDTSGYPSAIETIIGAISTISDTMFKEGYRFANALAVTVDGTALSTASGIADSTNFGTISPTAPTVGVVATSSVLSEDGATVYKSVGEVLGQCAAISIQQSIGDVSRAAVSSQAYFHTAIAEPLIEVGTLAKSIFDLLGPQQVILHRTRIQRSGRYYNDGSTCNLETNALSALEFVRVANVVCDDAEYFFQGLINTPVPLDANGNAADAYTSSLEQTFYNSYCAPRVSAGECSSVEVTVTGENFVSTRQLEVSIGILPAPTCREIFVYTFYVTTTA